MAEAVRNPRHDIAFELMTALFSPSRIVRCVSHRSNDTVFAGLVILVAVFPLLNSSLVTRLRNRSYGVTKAYHLLPLPPHPRERGQTI
jgi:hypothetical protein